MAEGKEQERRRVERAPPITAVRKTVSKGVVSKRIFERDLSKNTAWWNPRAFHQDGRGGFSAPPTLLILIRPGDSLLEFLPAYGR